VERSRASPPHRPREDGLAHLQTLKNPILFLPCSPRPYCLPLTRGPCCHSIAEIDLELASKMDGIPVDCSPKWLREHQAKLAEKQG
jgi:hypothetical protein